MAEHPLVVIENGVLAALATNAKAVKEFPFLRGLATPAGGCGGCAARRAARAGRTDAFAAAKAAVAGLADDRKRLLKKFLNARKVRVVYLTGDRRGVSLTF